MIVHFSVVQRGVDIQGLTWTFNSNLSANLIMHERANMIKSIRRIAPRLQPRRCSRSLHVAGDNPVLGVSEEVREAVHSKRPVVALETTIYTHGSTDVWHARFKPG